VAENTTRQVALMAIRPQYAEKILSGAKTVEFRRTRIRKDITHVVIYATAPLRALVGVFEVSGVEEATPDEMWSRYARVGGIEEEAFRKYFSASSRAFAIRVGRVFQLEEPAPLQEIAPRLSAPQSYRYIDRRLISEALGLQAD